MWEQVLGVKQVGTRDNFFEIGGHSLLATQVVTRLSRISQKELPLRALFESPTVAGLAARLADTRLDQAQRLASPPRPQPRPAELPLAFAQQRLWFLNQLAPATPAYNLPLAMRLSGPFQVKALSKSLSEVARRHEALRTTFPIHNNAPVQSIHPLLSPDLPVVDLSTLPQAQQDRIVRRIVNEETQQPFDLAGGPLLRALLLQLADNEHVLVLNLHHIIADGWSQEVLVRELSALYRAYVHARVSPLPDLPLQYADYTLWQQAWLKGEILQSHLDYWQQQLAGAPTMLELPTDRPRPAVQTFRGSQSPFLVPQELTEGLKTLSRQEGVTLFMSLLAGFALLLARYSGQEDVLIGTPIANRPYADLEQLIGFFVNTLVLRADLAGNPSATTLLGRVREMALNAYTHQDLPFEKLVETLAPERTLSHSPLFQVMFALQHTAKPLLDLDNVELQSLNIDGQTARFALTLSMRESKQALAGVLEYNTDLFDASTIERMTAHFLQVLREMVADPSQHLREIPLLTKREHQLMLIDWNSTRQPLPVERLVHQLFEAQVERNPDALALQYIQQVMTYSELNQRANQLAHRLHRHGIGPEALVGVCLPRGFDLVIALLAILKAGGAYVPLDPAYPPERLAFMLQNSQARLLITTIEQQTSALFMEQDISRIYLDVDVLETESQENLASVADAQHTAYVIYTSGSTGQPKGTQITQRSLLNLLFWHQKTFGVTPRDRATHLAGLSFDAATWELWPSLISGACVCLLDEQTRLAPLALADWLAEQAITISFLPTPLTEQVLTTSWPEFTRLRFLLAGGDRLHSRPATPLPFTLVNNYGPTEYTVVATSGEVSATITDRLPDIGRPISNTRAYLLDEFLAPLPIGCVGELYLAGEGLARGYLHQPALTAERFLPDPFSTRPGARLYRTGDLACYQPDGSLQFVGRRDHQVKLRGSRIELGEIETLLAQHPEVREAVVLLRQDRPGDPRLVGYLVPRTAGSEPSREQLRAFLAQHLPDAMLPVSYVTLESLPLSLNGKVERAALPAPAETRGEKQHDEPGEGNAWEEIVAGVWEQVLGVKQVGTRDNFFEIGGHSLLATQVMTRLSGMLQRELPLKIFFEAPTVGELAHHLNQTYQSEPARSIAVPGRQPRPTNLPLSFAQQRLWFLDQMEPGSSFYNLSASLRLEGPLRVAALEQSFNTITARHEALRTSFRVVNGEPAQLISAELRVPLTIVALEHIPVSQQTAEVRRIAREEFLLPFDLAAGQLMRVHLLRLRASEHLLLLSLHHIVCDGWSMQMLMHELTTLYRAYTRERVPALPELPLQYADYTLWQRAWLQGEILQSHLDYWQQQLAGAPTILELSTDRPRPAVQTFNGAFQRITLSQELTERLKTLSQQEGVTLFMTLLAAFATLLSRYSGQKDLLIGSPIANRQHAQLERLIGCFANTLVLRADLSGSPTFRKLLGRVREMALEAYAHQDLPFERLVEVLEPERSLSRSPLFQVIFALQNAIDGAPDLADLNVELLAVENRASKYDLGLSLQETPTGLAGVFEYNIDLFDAATIERMGDHLRQLLEGMVANPEQPLETLPWLTEREHRQILGEWNQTQAAYPQEGSFSRLFEQQVQRTPDAVALVFEEEHLTYQELNEHANQLARLLRKRSVQAETLVGIALERSPDLVVAVLAIFKAGAAYVPFDPGYPAERLTFMLNDTRAPVMLTQTHLLERLPITEDQAICLDRAWSLCATEARSDLPGDTSPESLAYMIYTSGSTGRPKGVLVPHRGVCNLAEVQRHLFAIQPGERVLQFASLSFDASLWEIIMALYVGATLCLATRETLLPGSALVKLLQEQAITAVTLPPSALSILPVLAFPALRIILTTGEASTSELVETWASAYRFFNGYGPTEITICTTVFECQKNGGKPPPIGRPIANLQTYVLDARMQPVPAGIPGELYIGGDALTRGYHRRPELTAECFVPHPFSTRPGQRLYRTGDLVRYLPDGLLEFVGRVDTQVKLRGYRIELREIELALRQHPDVREAVVIMQENLPGGKRLVAYVVGADQHTPASVNELRHHLQERLPDYMVPAALLVLERLPLNANGKVDRRLLPDPEGLRPEIESHYQAPQTPTEQVIAAVWQEVLRLDRVGMDDNFFDLGGHSLLIVQVQSKLRDILKRDLTIVDLFKYPTIGSLARYIGENQSDPAPPRPGDERARKLKAGKDRLKQLRTRTGRGVQREKEF
ncbi:MAG TPA: amino acid adenylation domain-containing protein [Ktedonobacteraceae bacterium]